jgi:prephenate dehydrogenase
VTAIENARVTVIGLGLMGGSLAGALKTNRACREVIGVARRSETAVLAVQRGLVDRASTDLTTAVSEADLVVLATPVRTIVDLLPVVGRLVRPGCLVMDLGSTKRAIIEAMSALPEHVQAVGGHPMCGKETSGLAAADPGLYRGRVFVLTPLDRADETALSLASELVEAIGALPLVLGAERHDRLAAAVSHLPYLLACGLVRTAEEVAESDNVLWQLAASGFRDTSRLAASELTMMLDILLSNSEAVLDVLSIYERQLRGLAQLVRSGDEQRLHSELSGIRTRRLETGAPSRSRE